MRYVPDHGSRAMYGRGCRCASCTRAAAQYRRERQAGKPTTGWPRASMEDRFWSKVDRSGGPDTCWLWTASRTKLGYGQFFVATGKGPIRASRMAWILTNGEPEPGELVCHRCDNPPCCNPAHLFLGTNADNMADMAAKGRHVGTRRLTPDQVVAIRARYSEGHNQYQIAAAFGVSQSAVSAIVLGKRWAHVLPGDATAAVQQLDAALGAVG